MNIGNCFSLNGKIETEALSVVLLQMLPEVEATCPEEVDKNIDKVFAFIDRATNGFPGFDIIVTPEIILNGFCGTFYKGALKRNSPQIQRLKDKCKTLGIWGVFGLMMDFEDGTFARNCALTINADGEIADIYSKTTPWIPVEPSSPGEEIKVFDGPKGSRIGVIICSDGDYQDSWSEAAYKGANVIVRISDYMTPYQDAYEITNRAGAYFNRCYVLATNTSGMDDNFCLFGRSMVVNPDGGIITQAPDNVPYIIKADIYPGLCDHIQTQALMGNLLWQRQHRGASSPDDKGLGAGQDKSVYTYLKK
jgi:amidase/formamidase